MAKAARFDGSVDEAYLAFDLPSPESEVWLTFRCWMTDANRIAIGATYNYIARTINDVNFPASGDFTSGVAVEDPPAWSTGQGPSVEVEIVPGVCHLIELRHDEGAEVCQLYVDGDLIVENDPMPFLLGDTAKVLFGFQGIAGSDPETQVIISHPRVGTTRGGTDLFDDDFSDETFDAWTLIVGDVTIVDDPCSEPIGISIASADPAFALSPTWVRLDDPAVTDWTVTGWTITRGRNTELELTDTGIATIDLVDKTGSFDPTNPSGPFYAGGLDPNRQAAIRFRNPDTGEYRYLFKGFVAGWTIDMDPSARFSRVTLELEDGFALLAATHMSPGTFGDLPPAGSEGDIYWSETDGIEQVRKRINDILDQVGWPSTWRHVFSGNVSLPTTVYSRGESALTMLRDCADAEFSTVANLYCSRRGTVVFHGRYARFDPSAYEATDDDLRAGPAGVGGRLRFWTVGGLTEAEADPTIARLSSLAFRRAKEDVINSATVVPKLETAGFGDDEVADLTFSDVPSITAYGWRTVEYDDLLIKQGNTPPGFTAKQEAGFMGEYITENFKDPKTQIRTLAFNPLGVHDDLAPALWAFVCGVEIGDVVTVTTTHPGGGGFNEDFFVEGIRYEWTPGQPVDEGVQNLTMDIDVSPVGFYAHNPWGDTPPDPEGDDPWVPPE